MLNPHKAVVNVIRAESIGLRRTVGLWRWRRLVVRLARHDFRARYAGSLLGLVWAIIEPAVQFGLYLVLFSVLLGMRLAQEPGVGHFGLYLIAGMVPFLAWQESTTLAVGYARASAGLIRHVRVPVEVHLGGAILAVLARYAVALGLVAVAAACAGTVRWTSLPWLFAGVAMLACLVWGGALALYCLGAYLPDLVQVMGTATTVLFFLTPIVYPETQFPAAFRRWLFGNPMVGLLETFRAGLIGAQVAPLRLASAAAAAVAVLIVGAAVFGLREPSVRDLV
jgi:homopolymeric O-antigen transport system permease protein